MEKYLAVQCYGKQSWWWRFLQCWSRHLSFIASLRIHGSFTSFDTFVTQLPDEELVAELLHSLNHGYFAVIDSSAKTFPIRLIPWGLVWLLIRCSSAASDTSHSSFRWFSDLASLPVDPWFLHCNRQCNEKLPTSALFGLLAPSSTTNRHCNRCLSEDFPDEVLTACLVSLLNHGYHAVINVSTRTCLMMNVNSFVSALLQPWKSHSLPHSSRTSLSSE